MDIRYKRKNIIVGVERYFSGRNTHKELMMDLIRRSKMPEQNQIAGKDTSRFDK